MWREVAQTDSQRVLGKSDNEKLRSAVTWYNGTRQRFDQERAHMKSGRD